LDIFLVKMMGADALMPPFARSAATPAGRPCGGFNYRFILETTNFLTVCLFIIPKKENINTGGQGAHPLGCLPLWGREGVTLANIFCQQKVEYSIPNSTATSSKSGDFISFRLLFLIWAIRSLSARISIGGRRNF
jgi:hypothetical protein